MKTNANKRNIIVNITLEDINNLYIKQNGLSGLKMTHTLLTSKIDNHIINKYNISIDRINSELGYNIDNIQLVCAIINRLKYNLPNNNFIDLCSIITIANSSK